MFFKSNYCVKLFDYIILLSWKTKNKKNYKRYDINKVDIYMKVFVLSSFILIKQKFFFCWKLLHYYSPTVKDD